MKSNLNATLAESPDSLDAFTETPEGQYKELLKSAVRGGGCGGCGNGCGSGCGSACGSCGSGSGGVGGAGAE